MIVAFFRLIDPLIVIAFRIHDDICDILGRYLALVKKVLLLGAFLSLFFLALPEMRRDFGSYAQNMLLGILFLGPLSKIFRMRLLLLAMSLRRELGILIGCFALVHGISYFIDSQIFTSQIEPYLNTNFFSMQPLFFFGIITLFFTTLLFITSNNLSVRFLGGKNWKRLHRLVYVLLVVMLAHIIFVKSVRNGSNIFEIFQAVFLVLSYIFLKLLSMKNFIPFLQESIVYVKKRYDQYQAEYQK